MFVDMLTQDEVQFDEPMSKQVIRSDWQSQILAKVRGLADKLVPLTTLVVCFDRRCRCL